MRSQEPIVIDSDEESLPPTPRLAVKAEQNSGSGGDMEAREALKVALARLDSEIKSVVTQLEPLQALHSSLVSERRTLESQLTSLTRTSHLSASTGAAPLGASSSKAGRATATDYQTTSFPWTPALLPNAARTFTISSFRLCQEGVINAVLDDRDVVCVMPTGGGKSLTYQLPAVMGRKGVTVVVSPLVALIWDQVRGLKEVGVECVMMTGATSKEEQNTIYKRLEDGLRNGTKEIRLCYVTPEKISKSKRLMSALEKVNASGRLTRFVIDEAHCCSQLGHDFRPDYKKLSVLKTLFPRVPIQAVTATLSTKTLPDLLKILRLPPITDGRAANTTGTVFFSAPLYRPNLLYRVLSKPSNAKAAVEAMGKWIQEKHPGESGIIYCLSKKDAETVADQLKDWSSGAIKTGVYHAGVDDWAKERIHVDWRNGKVNVICATIAFGLGIDKGDVRYVIHHSMSKSLEGYYQETGRAGRDGKPSDCVLFYRGQDASRLASLIYGEVDGMGKLHEMLRFAQDLTTCRKIAFAKYFSASDNLSTAAWDHADTLAPSTTPSGEIAPCGQCDNCLRPSSSDTALITRDVTLDSWRVLRVLEEVKRQGGRVTLANAVDLVRGLGGGTFGVQSTGKKRKGGGGGGEEKGQLDVGEVAGGKVGLSKDDTERLLIHLTLLGYLEDSFSATSYSVNVYVVPSARALRLSRLQLEDVQSGASSVKVEMAFEDTKAAKDKEKKPRARKSKPGVDGGDGDATEETKGKGGKKKIQEEAVMAREDEDEFIGLGTWDEGDDGVDDDQPGGGEDLPGEFDEFDDDDDFGYEGEVENGWKVVRGDASVRGSSKRARRDG